MRKMLVSISSPDGLNVEFVDRAETLPGAAVGGDMQPYLRRVHNDELRERFAAWVAEAVTILDPHSPPSVDTVQISLSNNGPEWRGHSVGEGPPKPSFDGLVENYSSDIWNQAQLINLLDFVEQSDDLRAALFVYDDVSWAATTEETHRWNFYALYLKPFLAIYLWWLSQGHDEPAVFSNLYRHVETIVYERESIAISTLYLFRNFATLAETSEITPGLTVRLPTADEQARLIRSDWERRWKPVWGSVTPRAVIERSYRLTDFAPGLTATVLDEGRLTAARLEFALRLIHIPFVAAGIVEWTSDNPLLPLPSEPQAYLGSESTRDMPNPKGLNDVFRLTDHDIPDLQETWNLSSRTVSDRRFEVARKRLEQSVAEALPEDRLIDEWIALEALFLKSGEKSEIAYRASFRIARYLGGTFDERKTIQDVLNKSYAHRSEGGVHGSAVAARVGKLTKQQDLMAKEAETARLLRLAIRQCLREGASPDIGAIEDGFLK